MYTTIIISALSILIFISVFQRFEISFFFMIRKSFRLEAKRNQSLLLLSLFLCISSTTRSNTYYVSKNGNDSNKGDLSYPWLTLAKASNTLIAGDTVLIRAGVYNESLWPLNSGSENAPVCYFGYGDGEVIVRASGFNDNWGVFTIKGKGSKGFIKPVNHIHVKGLTFRGSNHFGICIYGGDEGLSGNHCIFENIRCDSNSVGAYFTCQDLNITNSEFTANRFGGCWVYQGGRNIRIKGSSFHHNGTSGNIDGMTLQDCENVLIEDCEAYGQYDGFDAGSQEDENKGPGCRFIIFRRCKAYNNYNGNFPSSTTLKGPICYQYCTAYDNTDWAGGMVLYEAARNTHIWNCTITRVNIGINFFQGPGPVFLFNNIIIAQKNAVLNGAGGEVVNDYNLFNGSISNITNGDHNKSGTASFVDAGKNIFFLTSENKELIDNGTFFLRTTGTGTDVSTISVNGDPRIYFCRGDTIQLQNAGLRIIDSLTDRTITVRGGKLNYRDDEGIHLRYSGHSPDIGAYEFTDQAKNDN
jgi:hypothetical protein